MSPHVVPLDVIAIWSYDEYHCCCRWYHYCRLVLWYRCNPSNILKFVVVWPSLILDSGTEQYHLVADTSCSVGVVVYSSSLMVQWIQYVVADRYIPPLPVSPIVKWHSKTEWRHAVVVEVSGPFLWCDDDRAVSKRPLKHRRRRHHRHPPHHFRKDGFRCWYGNTHPRFLVKIVPVNFFVVQCVVDR